MFGLLNAFFFFSIHTLTTRFNTFGVEFLYTKSVWKVIWKSIGLPFFSYNLYYNSTFIVFLKRFESKTYSCCVTLKRFIN